MATAIDYTAENAEKAVKNFYCNSELQQEVHQWLTAAQTSREAWSFCWQLLTPDKDVQVQFYGASCLHVKISKFLNELPQDQYESLKTKTIEQVINYARGPKLILNRLCIAKNVQKPSAVDLVQLSSLALNSMPEHWEDPLDSLTKMFQDESSPLSSAQRCSVLLEIFTVLPEEFFNANLSNQRRSVLRFELNNSLTKILQLLTNLMTPSSPADVYEHALKCFSSWVEFGIPMNESENIIVQVFQCLNNPQLFETAVDTLVNVFSHPDSHRFPYTIQKLLGMISSLQDMLNKAVEERDQDTCQGVTQVVVAIAENHTKLILDCACGQDENRKTDVMKLVQLALGCSCVPGHYPIDEICSSMTFTFWYILQDNLFDMEPSKSHVLLPIFQPIYFSLIENLLVKVQFPLDEVYDTWTAEEKEQFRCYRQDIGDTMMYAFHILREPLLGHLCNALSSILETNKELDVRWQLMEAIFFLFSSVAESVDLEESLYLPSLLELLPKIPFSNIKFISTALSMIGSFGEWLSYHPSSLRSAIPLLLQGLNNPEVAMAASMALKDVTRENLDHIQPHVQDILQACQTALEGRNLKSREQIRLMSCIGQVLSVLPFDDIMNSLNPILTPHIQGLEQLSQQQPSVTIKTEILVKVNMLSWLFASLDTDRDTGEKDEQKIKKPVGPKPVFIILQQIAPVLRTLVSTWITDAGVVEAICELLKRALQTLMDDFAPLSKDVAELLSQMYQTVPHVAIIDLTKQLILMFHGNPEFSGSVKLLLDSICNKTLELFQGDVQQSTDVVEAFMSLLSQILRKTKDILLDTSSNLAGLFQAGIVGLSLPENHTVKAACIFLTEFLGLRNTPVIQEIVLAHGQHLLDRIMRAIGGESPRMIMEHVGDVLTSLSKNYTAQVQVWSAEMVVKEGYPCTRCTEEDKRRFFKSVLREYGNKRRSRTVVKEFTLLCRGLLGTEYAAQMADLM